MSKFSHTTQSQTIRQLRLSEDITVSFIVNDVSQINLENTERRQSSQLQNLPENFYDFYDFFPVKVLLLKAACTFMGTLQTGTAKS